MRKLKNVVSVGGDSDSPRKLKNVVLDTTAVYSMQTRVKNSTAKIDEYIGRRKNNEYMTSAELDDYKSAIGNYSSTMKELYRTGVGNKLSSKDRDMLSALESDIDSRTNLYKNYKNADEYNKALRTAGYYSEYKNLDYSGVVEEIEKLRVQARGIPNEVKFVSRDLSKKASLPLDPTATKPEMSADERQERIDWLTAYGNTVITPWDYERKMWGLATEIDEIRRDINIYKARNDSYNAWTNPQTEEDRIKDGEFYDKYWKYNTADSDPTSGAEKYMAQLQKEYDQYEFIAKYGFLSQNTDYTDKSVYDPSLNVASDDYTYYDIVGEYKKRNGTAKNTKGYVKVAGAKYSDVFDQLEDEEIADILYLYNTGRGDEAQKYIETMVEELNYREGMKMAQNINNIDNKLIKGLAKIGSAIVSGYDSFSSGLGQLISEEEAPTSKHQYASGAIREDIDSTIGKVGYDLLSTTVNMAPSILVSTVLGNLGAPAKVAEITGGVLLGSSAAGNAYAEAKRQGYTTEQARNYGVLVGASEAALQNVLGGISAFGGMSGKIADSVKNIDKALLRAAANVPLNMVAEGTEEYLQEILDPVFRNLMLGEDNEFKLVTEEAAYSFLLGALSAGFLEGGPEIINTAARSIDNKIKYSDNVNDLVAEALEIQPDYKFAQQMQTKLENGETLTGGQITQIINHNEKNIRKNNIAKINNRLTALGETGNIEDITSAIIKIESGEELTRAETRALGNSRYGEKVLNERAEGVTETVTSSTETKKPENTSPMTNNTERVIPKNKSASYTDLKIPDLQSNAKYNAENTPAPEFDSVVKLNNGETGYKAITTKGTDVVVTGIDVVTGEIVTDKGNFKKADITFSDNASAALVENATQYDNHSVADLYVTAYNPQKAGVGTYNKAFRGIYNDAKEGRSFEKAWDSYNVYGVFSKDVAEIVYNAGQKEARVSKQIQEEFRRGDRRVYVDVDRKSLTERQKVSLKAIEAIARATGIKFYTFASYAKDGKRYYKNSKGVEKLAPNGYYDPKDSSIHIDLNAGKDGEGTMLFTAAHELTHYIKQWSPTKFETLADFLLEQYAEKDVSVEALVQAQIEKAKANGRDIDYDTAFEEVIADSMESMLTDGKVAEKLTMLAEKDMSLVKKIKSYLKQLFEKIRQAYAGLNPNSREGRLVAEMGDAVEKLQNLFAEAIADASANMVKGETHDNGTTREIRYDDRYSDYDKPIQISDIKILRSINRKSISQFDSKDIQKAAKWAHRYYRDQNMGIKSPFFRAWLGDWREHSTQPIQIADVPEYVDSKEARKKNRGVVKNQDVAWEIRISKEGESNTISHAGEARLSEYGLSGIRELIEKAILLDSEVHEHHKNNAKDDRIAFDHKFYALGESTNKTIGLYKITVEETFQDPKHPQDKRFHNLKYIEKVADNIGSLTDENEARRAESASDVSTTKYSVSDLFAFVKKYDTEFKYNPASKTVLNKDGTPKVFYHGSPAQFTAFDKRKAKSSGLYGKGFYFTDSQSHAGTYGNTYAVYLNITNPLKEGEATVTREQVRSYLERIAENEDYSIENYGTYDIDSILDVILEGENTKDAFATIQDINATTIGDFVEATELFNEVNGTKFDGIIVPTETVAFNANQIKSATWSEDLSGETDNIGIFDRGESDIRYSDRDSDTYTRIYDMQIEVNELTKKIKEMETSLDFKTVSDNLSKAIAENDIDNGIKAYQKWMEDSGYKEIKNKRDRLRDELGKLRKEYSDQLTNKAINEEKAAIEKSGLSEADYFRNQAVKEFGYTPYFYDAGYITPNGKMLNFSGEKGKHFGSRGQDHRAIGVVYADTQGGAALVRFMSGGNIRIMAETPGIDIITTTEPTSKQYSTIKSFVRAYRGEGFFCVDFTDENGMTVGNYTYEGSPNPDRVVNDIKYFYENGEIREQSDISSFLYQDRGETSSRSILAGALEGTAQTDAEKAKLAEYREKAEALDQKQAELAKVRAEIKKLSFAKGKRDTAKISALRKKAAKLVSSINYYDKQLLGLESTQVLKDVLQREKTKAVERQKAKDAKLLENFKAKAGAQQEAITKRYQEARKRSVEGRKKTALRHDILDTIKDLKKLLERGTKDRNVKNGMKDTVSSAIALGELLFGDYVTNADIVRYGVDSVTEKEAELLEKYRELLIERDELNAVAENTDPETVKTARTRISSQISRLNDQLSDLFEREKSRLNRVEAKDLIQALKRDYESLKDSADEYIKGAYNPEMAVMFDAVESELKDAVAGDLTLMQLQRVRDLYKMLKHTVSTSNKMFGESRKETLSEMVDGVQNEILHWAKDKKDPVKLVNDAMHVVKSYSWNELKPVYAFETIGSDMFKSLYMDAVYAEGVFATDIDEARSFVRTQRSEHGYYSWDMNTATKFTIGDNEISLTLGEMMTVYALAKREQALEHMTVGGFKFGVDSKYKNTKKAFEAYKSRTETADPFTVDTPTIANITAALTSEQRDYVDKMQRYMSEVMGEKGNAISRQLYGIDLFTEENYMPIQSVKDYISSISQALNAAETQVSLKNTGVSKPTVPHASNPLILRSFEDVWLEHIDTMAKYHAFVLPIENLQRVFNSSKRNESGHSSTQAVITKTFGTEATAYISQYIKDLNGGAKVTGYNGSFMQLFGKFKMTAVAASLSVAIQQPWAIVRAMDMISPIYFREFFTTTTNMALNKEYDELRKYAPVAILKEIGGFDIGSSRSATEYMDAHVYKGFGAKVKGVFTDSKYRASFVDNAVMGLASQMDKLGWTTIWEAVKREQRAHYKHLDKKAGFFKSDEFLEKCGKRFTEVIAYTQVYDSVNSRSGMMRSKHDLVKFATSFMGEPTTVINQAYLAALRVARAESGERGRTVARSLRTVGVLGLSIILTKAAAALIYAGRDDDEDEGYWEKWLQSFGKNLRSEINPMNSLPFMRDLVSLWDGWSIERPDTTLLAEATDAFRMLMVALTDEDKNVPLDEIFNMADHTVNMLGFPLRNIRRDAKAVINTVKTAFDGIGTDNPRQAFIEGWNGESLTSKDRARKVENIVSKGDYDDAKEYVGDWVSEKAADKARNDGYDINNISGYLKAKYEEEGRSAVKEAFTTEFRKRYLEAVSKGDAKTTKAIRVVLYNTGLYDDIDDTFLSWRQDDVVDTYCDQYKQAYVDGDTKTMQRVKAAIVKTDLWTVSEVNKKLISWEKSADELTDKEGGS